MNNGIRFWTKSWALIGFLCFSAVTPALADAGFEQQRFSAEILIVRGDVRRLLEASEPAHHRRGALARIGAALSSLGMLAREARQERGRGDDERAAIDGLRAAFAADEIAAMVPILDGLAMRNPLDLSGFRQPPSPQTLAQGREIHETLCAGCHDDPDLEPEAPAFDLFAMARETSESEFAARLIGGLRGTPATALANPFTARDMAALLAFYRAGP